MSKFYYLEIGDGYTSEGKEQDLIPPELLKEMKGLMEDIKRNVSSIRLEVVE